MQFFWFFGFIYCIEKLDALYSLNGNGRLLESLEFRMVDSLNPLNLDGVKFDDLLYGVNSDESSLLYYCVNRSCAFHSSSGGDPLSLCIFIEFRKCIQYNP